MGANIVAAGGTITFHDSACFGGNIFAKQITLHNSCQLYSDQQIVSQGSSVVLTK